MNSLLISTLMLLTAHPTVTYQVTTDEFYEHNIYSFAGNQLLNTPQYDVYILNMMACEIREGHYDIVDETLFFNNKELRKSYFFFKKDYIENRCLLTVQKNPFVNKTSYYNHEYDYWYPDYNYIIVQPHQKAKRYFPRQTKRHRHRRIRKHHHGTVVLSHKTKPRIIAIKQKPKYKKKHHKKKHHKKH